VVAQEGAVTGNELRERLRERLPEYMVPSAIVILDALPLSPNGKVDRKALPAPEGADRFGRTSYVAPRTPLEEGLAEIWGELLQLEQVGIHDNFFDLGGHSIMATQVVSRLQETFQVEVPVRALFDTPTIEGLAEWMLRDPETRSRIESLAELLASLSRLSDEELEERLNRADATGDDGCP